MKTTWTSSFSMSHLNHHFHVFQPLMNHTYLINLYPAGKRRAWGNEYHRRPPVIDLKKGYLTVGGDNGESDIRKSRIECGLFDGIRLWDAPWPQSMPLPFKEQFIPSVSVAHDKIGKADISPSDACDPAHRLDGIIGIRKIIMTKDWIPKTIDIFVVRQAGEIVRKFIGHL